MRIVFTPWGSFGDLHPYMGVYMGVALEMQRRGHDVLIASTAAYREKVEGEGLSFYAVRPDMQQYAQNPKLMAHLDGQAARAPLFEGQFSPSGTLAFFSRALAQPQPDWPANVTITGFPFYDKLAAGSSGLSSEIQTFLAAGPPPVVFTLGTSAVLVPSNFYSTSAAAIEKLNLRAILLASVDFKNRMNLRSTEKILVAEYAPYSELFPQAAAVVHSGGIGTTAQVLRAGKPMMVMPFSHDQPDNAARITRLGVGTTVSRSRYTVKRVAREIEKLLIDGVMAARACDIAKEIQAENGIEAAADAIERIMSAR